MKPLILIPEGEFMPGSFLTGAHLVFLYPFVTLESVCKCNQMDPWGPIMVTFSYCQFETLYIQNRYFSENVKHIYIYTLCWIGLDVVIISHKLLLKM